MAVLERVELERAELEEILSRGEFTAYTEGTAEPGDNVLLLLLQRFFEALERLFPNLEMAESSGDALSYLLIAIGAVVLLALTTFLLRLIWVERKAGRRQAAAHADELAQTPAELMGRARAAAASGDAREATRLTFLALLLGLQERGLIGVEAWKTNGEYAEELAAKGGRYAPMFRASALRFDAVWYGGRAIGADELRAWFVEVEAVLAAEAGADAGAGGASA